ncbi:MAG: permease [Hyphomicrobiaceae bacterium]
MTILQLPAGRRVSVDAVLLLIGLILAALAVTDPAQFGTTLTFVANAVIKIAPFFFASIAIAAYANASGADNLIGKAFQGRATGGVVAASLVGALSPFCSCGVIPVIAALLFMGVPLAPVLAFCMASPIMDPAMFALTAGTLGFDFAVAKTVIAVGMGLLAGFVAMALVALGWLGEPLREGVGNGGCGAAKVRNPKDVVWQFWSEPARIEKARDTFLKTGLFLGKMLLLAFVLESLMVRYIPAGLIASHLGGSGIETIALATLAGVPAYLNGAAALPLVGELMRQGMAPGAGMAFLVGGGVTSIPAAMAVWAIMRPPIFATYIAVALVGAVLSGLGYQLWVAI